MPPPYHSVKVHGLIKSPLFNGYTGQVHGEMTEDGRVVVQLQHDARGSPISTQQMRLKLTNLQAYEPSGAVTLLETVIPRPGRNPIIHIGRSAILMDFTCTFLERVKLEREPRVVGRAISLSSAATVSGSATVGRGV